MLKEYELDSAGLEWRRLVAEVDALSRLKHPHIVEVQAVFQPKKLPTPVAYVQLAYYAKTPELLWGSQQTCSTALVLW